MTPFQQGRAARQLDRPWRIDQPTGLIIQPTGAETQPRRVKSVLKPMGNGIQRTYKVYGLESLDAESPWQYPTNSLHRFFKVVVEML